MSDRPKIVKLENFGGEISLHISTLDQPLTVVGEVAIKHRLKEGIVLTDSQVDILQNEAEQYRCNQAVVRLLALRSHSEGEVRSKLQRKQFSSDAIQAAIGKCRKQGLLDDSQFAYRQAEILLKNRPCGKSYLSAFLQRKKISRILADQTAEVLLCSRDTNALAVESLEKRWQSISQFELETARRKAYNYLSRRGFGYEAARAAFETIQQRASKDSSD